MKNIDKKSQSNRKSDDTWIYLLLLFLIALLVGGGIWLYIDSQKKPQTAIFDFKKELGECLTHPTAEETSKLISGNRSRRKTVQRILNEEMSGRRLTPAEKDKLQKELDRVGTDLDKIVQTIELKKLEEKDPAMLASLYSQFYEQAKILAQLKVETSANRDYEEVANQIKIQDEWGISAAEEEEINTKMHELITKWYEQAKQELLRPEQILTEYIEPIAIEGREIKEPTKEDINYFKKIENKIGKNGENKKDWEKTVAMFNQPLQITFNGYGGFITAEDSKTSEEGKETFGLTISDKPSVTSSWSTTAAKYFEKNCRNIVIKLKKELFFNRLGYEEWITDIDQKNNRRTFFDICFEEVVETIAHELAHAIVNSIEFNYEGQEGGGHGALFHDFMEKIEKMIKNSPEYDEFKKWWNLTKK